MWVYGLCQALGSGMIGRVFMGRYEAVRLLGEGGMGRVFLARQLDLGRQVVVKVMHDHVASDPKFRERFHRETLLMARFQHPFAVTLYDATLDDPQGPCIVMEYIRGVPLDALLKKNGRLSPARVGRLLGQLCEALQAAHAEGIVHRDLKPGNLMVADPDTPYEKIKVMDFGLATLLDPVTLQKLTQSQGEFAVGTPGYMCPEQVRGENMDHRGDLYSVGVILYELLSGRTPYAGRCSMDVLLAHATEQPPCFSEMDMQPLVSPAIESVVLKCLAKDPNERPANARELAVNYEAALFDNIAVPLPSSFKAPPRAEEPPIIENLAPEFNDTGAIVHRLTAWMPEAIATYKLRGFVDEVGGEIIESVPGCIRLRLGGGSGTFGWFGRKNRAGIEIELHMERKDRARAGLLHITAILKPATPDLLEDPIWRSRCDEVIRNLRSYLMGFDMMAEAKA